MQATDPLVVTTTSGPVRGRPTATGTAFLGVPYAAGPTGIGRFAAPTAHEPWTCVRDATEAGPTAPQPRRDAFGVLDMSPYFGPGWRRGVDYLTVDIWVPQRTHRPAPVMVFVHGGGFAAGSAGAPLYSGETFARDGVVLVVLNYRLGVPGFLHLPDAPDNRGLLDVLAALHWVQGNIERFGGDPANVTLFGQSAGAVVVGGVLADPAARGLVRRAIMQSGSGTAAFSREQAGLVARAAGRALDRQPTAHALADLGDDDLVAVVPKLAGLNLQTADHHDPLGGITPLGLVLDRQPASALADATSGTVDLLIGSNSEEGALYLAPLGLLSTSTDVDVHATAARFHRNPDALVRAYRANRPDASAGELRAAILGDGAFGVGTRRMAEAHAALAPTYAYEFTWRSNAVGSQLGAAHTMELPFVFDHVNLPALRGPNALLGTGAPPADLATWMHAAWIRFAATGDPGWPRYEPGRPRTRLIGINHMITETPRPADAEEWARGEP